MTDAPQDDPLTPDADEQSQQPDGLVEDLEADDTALENVVGGARPKVYDW